jgi:hypothetical protein
LAGKLVLAAASALFCRPTKDPNLMRFLAALAILLAVPAIAQAQGGREFGVWTAACDPGGFCSATAQAESGGSAFVVGRHAQEPYWELHFDALNAAVPDMWSDFTVSVDGDPLTFVPQGQVGAYGEDRDFYFLGEPAQVLMDRMTPGSALTVAFSDAAAAAHTADFSLSGLTAALLWIDEQQGRLGSERVAFAPPHGLVPVYAGQVAPDIPLALLDRHRMDPDCEPFEQLANGRDFQVGDLGDGDKVYLIPCQSGAYNFGHKVYVGHGEGADAWYDPQFFADFQTDVGWTGTPLIWNGFYDDATKTLTSFAKARGIGDCGSQAHWQWNTYLFVLVEMRARDCSDEDVDPDAEMPEFPVVYKGNRSTLQ